MVHPPAVLPLVLLVLGGCDPVTAGGVPVLGEVRHRWADPDSDMMPAPRGATEIVLRDWMMPGRFLNPVGPSPRVLPEIRSD